MKLECHVCTFKNHKLLHICEMCGAVLSKNHNQQSSIFLPSKSWSSKSSVPPKKEELPYRGPLFLKNLNLEGSKLSNDVLSAKRKAEVQLESSSSPCPSPSNSKPCIQDCNKEPGNTRPPLAVIPINRCSEPGNNQHEEDPIEAKFPVEGEWFPCPENLSSSDQSDEVDKMKKRWVKKSYMRSESRKAHNEQVLMKAILPVVGDKVVRSEKILLKKCINEDKMKKMWVKNSDQKKPVCQAAHASQWPWQRNSWRQNRWQSSLWNHQIFPHWCPPSIFGVERHTNWSGKEQRPISPSRQERLNINRNRRKSETFHTVGRDHTLERLKEIEGRRTLTHVILLDLDNWYSFFEGMQRLRDEHKKSFPKGTFLCGYSNGYEFQEPTENEPGFKLLDELRQDPDGGVVIETCLSRKDAADFAICVRFGQLDQALGVQIPITILSGDGGFNELTRCNKRREVYIVNPIIWNASKEDKAQQDLILYTRLISIGDQHHIPEGIL